MARSSSSRSEASGLTVAFRARGSVCGLAVAALAIGCNSLLGLQDVPLPADDASALPPVDSGIALDATDATVDATGADAGGAANDAASAGDAMASCGDTTSDTQNCGRCGHDCLGGACSASLCQPIALVTPAMHTTPTWLTGDDSYLYWTDEIANRIYRTDKTLGGAVLLTQGALATFPNPIAADDAGVFWGDLEGIWRCPKDGCVGGPVRVAQTIEYLPLGFAIDDEHVYWTEENSTTVLWAPKDGVDASPAILWQMGADASADFRTSKVAIDGERVYFIASDGRLRAIGLDGGGLALAGSPNPYGSRGIALDPTHVYWSVVDPSAGLIARAAAGSLAEAGTVVAGQGSPTAIATDGVDLYWVAASADGGVGTGIYGCAIASCQPTLLAGGYSILSLKIDAQAIYWTDYGPANTTGEGAVWKVAR